MANEQKIFNHTDRTTSDLDIIETFNPTTDHTEVIIGKEHGTTFPTQIGTSICHALIDTGATRSCISEKILSKFTIDENQIHAKYKHEISHW